MPRALRWTEEQEINACKWGASHAASHSASKLGTGPYASWRIPCRIPRRFQVGRSPIAVAMKSVICWPWSTSSPLQLACLAYLPPCWACWCGKLVMCCRSCGGAGQTNRQNSVATAVGVLGRPTDTRAHVATAVGVLGRPTDTRAHVVWSYAPCSGSSLQPCTSLAPKGPHAVLRHTAPIAPVLYCGSAPLSRWRSRA